MLWWTLQRLQSRNPEARRRAAASLYQRRDVRTVEPLLTALRDFSSEVRALVALALGEIGDARAVEPLVAVLKTWDRRARWAAIEALAKFQERAAPALLTALDDPDPDVRRVVIEALGNTGDRRAIEPLLPRLEDADYVTRRQAARAVEALGWHPQTARQRVLLAIATGQFESAVAERESAVEPLLVALQLDDAHVRSEAAWALGCLEDRRAVEPLVAALQDLDRQVRLAAAEALGRFGDLRALGPLLDLLREQATDVQQRLRAIATLGKIGDSRAVELLLEALRDGDQTVRDAAARALGTIQDGRGVTPLMQALKVEDVTVGAHAAETLAKLGPPAVMPLLSALRDHDRRVRSRAADALAKIGAVALEPLLGALEDRRFDLRQAAVETLAKTGDQRAVEPLIGALWDDDSDVRKAAAEALEALGWYPRDATERALDAVARREWPKVTNLGLDALEPLLWALKDRRLDVRHGAAEVLAILGWQPANTMHRVWFALALGKSVEAKAVGAEAALSLLMVLNTWDAAGRIQIVETLGQLEDARAVEALVGLTGDVEVAASAIHALERLLATCAPQIATEQLHAIVALGQVMQRRRYANPYDGFVHLQEGADAVECARVKQLAQRELLRRGTVS
jgi:HEAT repeat protein